MVIKKLVSDGEAGIKYATVYLSYEECRDLANGLCEYLCLARENKDTKTLNRYKGIYKKVSKLFHLVKCGWLLDEDIKYINHTIRDISEVEDRGEKE